jgi:hypothetical protein
VGRVLLLPALHALLLAKLDTATAQPLTSRAAC